MSDISYSDSLRENEASFGDYFALLKPRVMTLVVFTALVGLLAAPVPMHPFVAFCAILFIAVGGGASGALNMWYDADIDAVMKRTRKRPGAWSRPSRSCWRRAIACISCLRAWVRCANSKRRSRCT